MAIAVIAGPGVANTFADDRPAGPSAAAVEVDRSPAAIDKAVADLSSDAPTVRDAAAARLRAIGKDARASLERAAAADGASPELAARARAIIAAYDVPLDVVLSAPTTKVKLGQPLPPITVDVRNATRSPVTVCQPLDGCDVGWRIANYQWTITDANGLDVPRRGLGRCGNVNPLRPEDFVKLEPGKSLTIEPGRTFLSSANTFAQPAQPGVYLVSLRYTFDPKRQDKGLGGGVNKDVADQVNNALAGEFRSNVLKIEVTE